MLRQLDGYISFLQPATDIAVSLSQLDLLSDVSLAA